MNEITIVKSILSLRPNSKWVMHGDDLNTLQWKGDNRPTNEEILNEYDRLVKEQEYFRYRQQRASEYPSIENQLDIIFHSGVDAWKEQIQAIKDKFPKPE